MGEKRVVSFLVPKVPTPQLLAKVEEFYDRLFLKPSAVQQKTEDM